MKRVGGLWTTMISMDNLHRAFLKARRGKRAKPAARRFEFDIERRLFELHHELASGSYQPGAYRVFEIRDPKPRLICAAPFRDRVVHHAYCNLVEPIFERRFIHDSYACRPGKGTHAAVRRYRDFARTHQYVLKCDVEKFFPSVDHTILLERIARVIKDPRVLEFTHLLIASANAPSHCPGFFPGDDLFTPGERRRGLPIGNQTSQFFANVMLDPLDHYVKERWRGRHYLRYADDFVVLGDDTAELAAARDAIEVFLMSLRLRLHPRKRAISRVADGLPLLGYRVWPDHATVLKPGMLRFRRRLRYYSWQRQVGALSASGLTQRVQSLLGHMRQANTFRWRTRVLANTLSDGA